MNLSGGSPSQDSDGDSWYSPRNWWSALEDVSDEYSNANSDDDSDDDRVIVEGRTLWRHRPGRKEKAGNKKRARMDMSERIRKLAGEGDDEFKSTYKLSLPEFKRLAAELDRWLNKDKKKAGYVSSELRLSMALRYFAGGQQKDICQMHGVHNSTFYQALWQVVDFINGTIPLYYPLNEEDELQKVADGFSQLTAQAIPKCAGVIDGIAVQIKCPSTADTSNPMHYYNRKGFYAYVMQGVCDANLRYA